MAAQVIEPPHIVGVQLPLAYPELGNVTMEHVESAARYIADLLALDIAGSSHDPALQQRKLAVQNAEQHLHRTRNLVGRPGNQAAEPLLPGLDQRLADILGGMAAMQAAFNRLQDGLGAQVGAAVEAAVAPIHRRLDGIDRRLDGIDRSLDAIDGRLFTQETRYAQDYNLAASRVPYHAPPFRIPPAALGFVRSRRFRDPPIVRNTDDIYRLSERECRSYAQLFDIQLPAGPALKPKQDVIRSHFLGHV